MGSWRRQGYARARDDNEQSIVDAISAEEFIILRTDEPADLLIQCKHGFWTPIEIKNLDASHPKTTLKQKRLAERLFRPIPIVFTPNDCRLLLRRLCEMHSVIASESVDS